MGTPWGASLSEGSALLRLVTYFLICHKNRKEYSEPMMSDHSTQIILSWPVTAICALTSSPTCFPVSDLRPFPLLTFGMYLNSSFIFMMLKLPIFASRNAVRWLSCPAVLATRSWQPPGIPVTGGGNGRIGSSLHKEMTLLQGCQSLWRFTVDRARRFCLKREIALHWEGLWAAG